MWLRSLVVVKEKRRTYPKVVRPICCGTCRLILADDVVRHSARQSAPHLAGHQELGLVSGDAKLEELIHSLVQTGPPVAVLVVAGFEERPAATAGFLELVGELIEKCCDLGLVLLQALGVEPNVLGNAFGFHVPAGVFAFLEEAVHEDCVDPLGVENDLCAHCFISFFGLGMCDH